MRFEYIQATSSDVRKFNVQANNVAPYMMNSQETPLYPITAFERSSPPAPAAISSQANYKTQTYTSGVFQA